VWHNYLAIELGVANAARAVTIIDTADRLYAGIRQRFNVTAAQLWCAPTNLIPLLTEDLTVNFDGKCLRQACLTASRINLKLFFFTGEYVWPAYENGDCFHWHGGLEALARGTAV
jgi:hypothetical protein